MTTLGEKNVGDIVKIKENGVAINYIIVHKGLPSSMYDSSCDGVWLLREKLHSNRRWYGTDSTNCRNDYENSEIHPWLDNEFLNTIDSKIRAAIKGVKIPFKKGTGEDSAPVQSGSQGLYCKIFLLSNYELGFTTNPPESPNRSLFVDGARLSYFSNENNRIVLDKYGRASSWWFRSVGTSDHISVYCTNTTGGYETDLGGTYSCNSLGIRPAFILPPDLLVTSDGFVSTNTLPTITSSTASGSDLDEVSAPLYLTYTINDADDDTVTVKEYLDNVLQRSYTATLGSENTFETVCDPIQFQKILNGQHTIKVIANDTKDDSEPYTITFNKQVRTASIALAEPLPADDVIKAVVVSITGNIPQDAAFEVLVTNNALDENPVWEDMSREVLQSTNHVFENKTAANGFAFNFKVTAARGASGEQGFISSIGGAFE